jgi:hypothetical protein
MATVDEYRRFAVAELTQAVAADQSLEPVALNLSESTTMSAELVGAWASHEIEKAQAGTCLIAVQLLGYLETYTDGSEEPDRAGWLRRAAAELELLSDTPE